MMEHVGTIDIGIACRFRKGIHQLVAIDDIMMNIALGSRPLQVDVVAVDSSGKFSRDTAVQFITTGVVDDEEQAVFQVGRLAIEAHHSLSVGIFQLEANLFDGFGGMVPVEADMA